MSEQTATIGLQSLRSRAPVETKHGNLLREMLNFISLAVDDLHNGKPTHALAELEYAQLIANESFEDSQELRECFYQRPTCLKKCHYEGLPQ